MSKTGDWVIREQEWAALNQSHDLLGANADLQTELAVVRAMLNAAVDVIRDVEWEGCDCHDECPSCKNTRHEDHAPNCTLAAVLKRAGAGDPS